MGFSEKPGNVVDNTERLDVIKIANDRYFLCAFRVRPFFSGAMTQP